MGSLDMFVATETHVWRQILLLNLQADVSWLCFVSVLCLLRLVGVVFSGCLSIYQSHSCECPTSGMLWGEFFIDLREFFVHAILQHHITHKGPEGGDCEHRSHWVGYWSSDTNLTNLSVHLETAPCWSGCEASMFYTLKLLCVGVDGRTSTVKTVISLCYLQGLHRYFCKQGLKK